MPTRVNQAVWLENQNRWQIKVQADGVRKTFTSSTPGRAGKRECHKRADEWLEKRLIGENARVSVLFETWLGELKKNCGSSHHRQYDSYWRNWIEPKIGAKKIGRLTEQDIQSIINSAHQAGKSAKTLQNIRNCSTAFVKYARKSKATTLRPEFLTIPKSAPRGEKTILQPDDVRKLFSSSKTSYRGRVISDRLIHMYRFAVATGLRPGELIGLKNDNINGAFITIEGAINYDDEQTRGKNDNARRAFQLSTIALGEIRKQRAMLKREGLISQFVFPGVNGKHITQYQLANAWDRYTRHNELTRITPYEMRHTYVSINKDMPDALLKLQVGHAENMDTQGIYGHEVKGDMARAANLANKAFQEILKEK